MARGSFGIASVVVATALAWPSAVGATDKSQAEQLLEEGRRLLAEGRAADACPKLAASQRLEPAAATALALGDCHERRRLWASAWTAYREAGVLARQRNDAERDKLARERADQVEPRLAKVVVLASATLPAGAEVRRDNVPVPEGALGTPIPVDSGRHSVEAWVGGELKFRTSVTVPEEGGVVTVRLPALTGGPADRLPFSPAREAPDDRFGARTQRIVAIGLAGVGVVGVAVGIGFGASARSMWNDALQNHCDAQRRCDAYGVDEAAIARKNGNVATAAVGVGVVALATAAVLWLTSRAGEPSAGVASRVRAGGVAF